MIKIPEWLYNVLVVGPAILDQPAKVCYWVVGIVGWIMIVRVCHSVIQVCRKELKKP